MSILDKLTGKKSALQKQDDQAQQTQTAQESQLKNQLNQFSLGLVSIQDIIAPEAIEVDFTYQKINSRYTRTLFIAGYPRLVLANWLSPLINFPYSLDIAMHIMPVDVAEILRDLRRKITEMEAEITSDIRQGKITNIDTEIKLEDAKTMQEQLAKGAERFYQLGLYVTLSAPSVEELDKMTRQLQSLLGSMLLISKKASLQMDEGFKTTLPMGVDKLNIQRNMDTTSLATTFPFTSSELTMETGIVYGINEHNGSLVIFDRFSMENANMVVFAKSGAGKSYAVKLEALRQLMFGTEVMILDPENEYEDMTNSYGGEYINFSFGSDTKINPFDLSNIYEEGENELGTKINSLHALLKVMLGQMTAQQEATLDRALVAAYKAKGITPDPETQTKEPPLMEDLYKSLVGMESDEAADLAARLDKYIRGSFRGIFDKPTTINIKNQLTVFSVRDIEDDLRPVAMFLILDFIWTRIRKERKKRILIIDEAWYFMQHGDTGAFLHSIAKRARKYYLGLTTITQDVEDFMHSDYGRAIVTNASIQLLLKQSSAALPVLTDLFYLSEGEQRLLMAADVGEGLFFAGQNHVAIRVIASPEEHVVITTDPAELEARDAARKQQEMVLQQTTEALHQLQKPETPQVAQESVGPTATPVPGMVQPEQQPGIYAVNQAPAQPIQTQQQIPPATQVAQPTQQMPPAPQSLAPEQPGATAAPIYAQQAPAALQPNMAAPTAPGATPAFGGLSSLNAPEAQAQIPQQ